MTRPPGAAGYLSRYLWFGVYGRRTYVCHFIGTLEEPYKQSGFIEYYVYSEGWDIWFEAYST